MSSSKSITKSASIIGSATFASRILGFLRDVVIAKFFGTSMFAQAFIVAFRIPNLMRDLIGEGATNSAFVPVFTEWLNKFGKKEFWNLTRVIFNILIIVLGVITILGITFAPAIVKAIAPGFIKDAAKLELTIQLTRLMFPYLLLIGLAAYGMGVLNTLRHFTAPAIGPALLNISIITCAFIFTNNIYGLGIGVLIGGALQVLVQMPVLGFYGMRFKPQWRMKHEGAKRIGKLLIPRALGGGVYQINMFVSTILASLSFIVGDGAVAGLYYASRILQFPLAIFGIAVAQAALPSMSAHAVVKEVGLLKETILFSLRSIFFVLIPSTLGLMVLAKPIVHVLFERGEFSAYSTQITSYALLCYAVGLCAYGGIKILVNAFYSMQDTMTPVKVASFSLILNIVLNLMLMWPLKIGGLALGASIAGIVNFIILYLLLKRKIGSLGLRKIFPAFLKMIVASLIMAYVCFSFVQRLYARLFYGTNMEKVLALIFIIVAGTVVYIAVGYALGLRGIREKK